MPGITGTAVCPSFSSLRVSSRASRAMSTTTCKDPSVTWYNNQDGLNPCQQYQALRQLCDVGCQCNARPYSTVDVNWIFSQTD